MASTVVTIRRDLGCRVPSPTELAIAAGDSVTFSAESGAATTIQFTAEAAALLSVAGTSVNLAGGASVTFTVGQPEPRAYCVQVLPAGLPPQTIACESSATAVLRVLPGCDPDFNGPDVPPPN